MFCANKHRQALRSMLVLAVHSPALLNTRYICSQTTRCSREGNGPSISSKYVYIFRHTETCLCGAAFIECFNGCFKLCESVRSCIDLVFRVDSLGKQAETVIISTTNHEHSDFLKKSSVPRYRLKYNAKKC